MAEDLPQYAVHPAASDVAFHERRSETMKAQDYDLCIVGAGYAGINALFAATHR